MKAFMHKMSAVATTAIQAHTYQSSRESHTRLTGIKQEDILGNKISKAYSVFGSCPFASKSGSEYWFYCDIHLPTGFINNRPVNSHHIWRISPTTCLEPVSPLLHTTAIKIIIRLYVVKILLLIKQFGICLIDC